MRCVRLECKPALHCVRDRSWRWMGGRAQALRTPSGPPPARGAAPSTGTLPPSRARFDPNTDTIINIMISTKKKNEKEREKGEISHGAVFTKWAVSGDRGNRGDRDDRDHWENGTSNAGKEYHF